MKQLTVQEMEMVAGGEGSITGGSWTKLARKIATYPRGAAYAASAVAEVRHTIRTMGSNKPELMQRGILILQSAGFNVVLW